MKKSLPFIVMILMSPAIFLTAKGATTEIEIICSRDNCARVNSCSAWAGKCKSTRNGSTFVWDNKAPAPIDLRGYVVDTECKVNSYIEPNCQGDPISEQITTTKACKQGVRYSQYPK